MTKRLSILLLVAILLSVFSVNAQDLKSEQGGLNMKLSSPEFKNNELIPRKFTCQGEDINPALLIENIPQNTKCLALIMDDPDAPMGTWVHWVVFNILPSASEIKEDSIPGEQAGNSFARKDYGGPCPPSGTHRYFFKIYALDAQLELSAIRDKRSLENAMQGHILDKAELVGLYKKE